MSIEQIHYKGQTFDADKSEILFFCRSKVDDAVFEKIEGAFSDKKAAIIVPRITDTESFCVDPVTLQVECMSFEGFAIRSIVFREIGGIESQLGESAATDLLWRVRGKGYSSVYHPDIVICGNTVSQPYEERLLESLLMRCRHGRFSDVVEAGKLLLKALKHPIIYDVKRNALLKKAIATFPLAIKYLFRGQKKIDGAGFYGIDYGFSRGMDTGGNPSSSPLVSLVVRTYQRPEHLKVTLESLRNQTYKHFEVVVVEDDAAHLERLLSEFSDLDIRYIALGENKGRAVAGNKGFSICQGEYVNLLDDDDYLFPEYLEIAISSMKREDADIVFSRSIAYEIKMETEIPYQFRMCGRRLMNFPRMDVFSMSRQCLAASNGVLFKRELLKEVGGMREELQGHEDWSLWMRLMAKGRWTVQPFATCCFTVPQNVLLEQQRLKEYAKNDRLLREDDVLRYNVTAKELKNFYDGLVHDLMYLKQRGELDAYIDGEYQKVIRGG